MNDKKTLIIIVAAIIFFVMIVVTGILIGIALIMKGVTPTPLPPAPVQEVTIIAPPSKSSKFASDAGLLKIRDDLKTTQNKIDTMDLFEQQIAPPVFDLNIAIAPQT